MEPIINPLILFVSRKLAKCSIYVIFLKEIIIFVPIQDKEDKTVVLMTMLIQLKENGEPLNN
jgi:hypothetical protein